VILYEVLVEIKFVEIKPLVLKRREIPKNNLQRNSIPKPEEGRTFLTPIVGTWLNMIGSNKVHVVAKVTLTW